MPVRVSTGGRSPLWLSHRGRTIAALLLLCLAYTVVAAGVSLWRYRTCRTNWALDHANFTHSIHAIANLNPEVTLVSGDAGPHTARHDHFQPIRYLLALPYALFPDAMTLIVAKCAVFGLGVLACFLLARHRSGEDSVGWFAAICYVLAPGVFNLAQNDLYLTQLVLPLFLLAYYFLVAGRLGAFLLAGAATLACREEVMLLFGLLFLHQLLFAEDDKRRRLWAIGALVLGTGLLFTIYTLVFFSNDETSLWGFWLQQYPAADTARGWLHAVGLSLAYHWANFSVLLLLAAGHARLLVLSVPLLVGFGFVPNLLGSYPLLPTGTVTEVSMHYAALPGAAVCAGFVEFIGARRRLFGLTFPGRRKAARFLGSAILLALAASAGGNAVRTLSLPPALPEEDQRLLLDLAHRMSDEAVVLSTYEALPLFAARDEIYTVEEFSYDRHDLEDVLSRAGLVILSARSPGPLARVEATEGLARLAETSHLLVYARTTAPVGGERPRGGASPPASDEGAGRGSP